MPRTKAADPNAIRPKGPANAYVFFLKICRDEHKRRFVPHFFKNNKAGGKKEGVPKFYLNFYSCFSPPYVDSQMKLWIPLNSRKNAPNGGKP